MNLLNIDNHISCTSDSVKLLELYFFIVSVVLAVILLLIYITMELLVVLSYTVVDCIDGKVLDSLGDDDLYCVVTGLISIVCCGCSVISLVVSLVSCCSDN